MKIHQLNGEVLPKKSPVRVKGKIMYLASTLGTLRNDLFIAPHASNCRRPVAKGMMHQKVFTLPLPAPAWESGFGLVSFKRGQYCLFVIYLPQNQEHRCGFSVANFFYLLKEIPLENIYYHNSNMQGARKAKVL